MIGSINFAVLLQYVIVLSHFSHLAMAGTMLKPHVNTGILEKYDGRHIPYTITLGENEKLEAGLPVTINERSGKNGRGIALQDIAAPPNICMDRIADLKNYPKMVPKVRKVDVYEEETFVNSTTQVGAAFEVGIGLITFNYYLMLKHEPKYQTFTWSLDYRYNSDFDDNVGHWQVMPHPTKKGWSRVLYSCAVQLPTWVPEFIITFLTKTALVEATTWVRQESEKLAADPVLSSEVEVFQVPDVRSCFKSNDVSAWYETNCSEVEQQSSEGSAERAESAETVTPRKRKMQHRGSAAPSATVSAAHEGDHNSLVNRLTSLFFQSAKAPRDLASKESAEVEIDTSVGTVEDLERTRLSYERFKLSHL